MVTSRFSRGAALVSLVAGPLLACLVGVGCARPWVNPPAELLGRPWHNVAPPSPDTYPDPAQTAAAGLDAAFGNNPTPTPPPAQPETRPLNVLAISAGGKYSSCVVGLLNGWSAGGTRPKFDVVTGVSGGAPVAVYAFLGPQYDDRATDLIVNIRRRNMFRLHPVIGPLCLDAFATTAPFEKLIACELPDSVVAEIAREHQAGRRLFLATGNLTTQRPAVWDVGAIAASGRADAGDLVRKILLASVSYPGLSPPVEFHVTLNGVHYHELHGDAGPMMQAFVRTANGLPPGSDVFVVGAGKYHADVKTKQPRAVGTVAAAASNTLYTLFRANAWEMYALCAVTRSRFHLIATPPEVKVSSGSMAFDRGDQRALFEAGYRQGMTGTDWRTTPPGALPDEALVPRAGLDFVTAGAAAGAAP
jgi:hypothetical protein